MKNQPFFNRFLLLAALLCGCFSMGRAQCFSVLDFGAVGDGSQLCTRSIQAAIDSASAHYQASGLLSTVCFPRGAYVTGSLYLKSGVTLQIDSGAVLLGSTNPFDYVRDSVCRWTAMIFAVDQHHIAIQGGGTIDGRGFEVANNLVQYIHLGLVADELRYDRPNETRRPENIHFRNCDSVTIRGITLKNPGSWNQQYDRCRALLVEGVTVDAKSYWNNDGIDVVDCSGVVIRNCHFDAADDAYCFKSHSPDGVCENVLVENCYGRSSANGIKFGTATRGTFRHFRFRNITIHDTYRSAITVASVDGACIEDIEFDSIRSIHTGNPIFLRFSSRNRGKVEPCLKDIVIKNLYAEVPFEKPDAGYSYEGPVEDQPRNISPSSIVGTPGLRIQNVRLENIEIHYPGRADTNYAYRGFDPAQLAAIEEWERRYPEFSMWKELPAWGFYIRHADGVQFNNVKLFAHGSEYRPAIVMDDVRGASFNHLSLQAQCPKHTPMVVANNCTNISGTKAKVQNTRYLSSNSQPLTSDQILAQDNTSPCTAQGPLYKASMFGCKSNGTTLNTNSIQRAINHIAQQGGGTLVFEVGRYLTGTLHLRPGVHIQLNEGAILVTSPNSYDIDTTPHGHRILLHAPEQGLSRICGLGRIELAPHVQLTDSPIRCQALVVY